MTPGMFDFEKLVFLIDPGKNKRFNEWVCVPLFPELEEFLKPILTQCHDPAKPIVQHFSDWLNTRYTNVFSKLVKELKIPDEHGARASFHSLRGTAITWFKEHGIKGDELRSITGHDSSDVEYIYARDIASISKIAQKFKS
jgi:integrase